VLNTEANWKGVRPRGERLYRFGSSMSLVLILWIRLKGVAGPEYARLHTGGSITGGNSGNGVLPALNGEKVGNKNVALNDRASVGLPWYSQGESSGVAEQSLPCSLAYAHARAVRERPTCVVIPCLEFVQSQS
jgi:hypothetical protein